MFESIPDSQSFSYDELVEWVESRIIQLRQIVFTPDILKTFRAYELKEEMPHICGAEASPRWRRFFLAALMADWASYEMPVDRVDYARLKYIMTSAYPYFKVWCCTLPDGQVMPVGYTGWYPIAKFVFDGLQKDPSQIDDRGIFMPLRFIAKEDIRYAYAFNVSIIRQLRNTVCSGRMIRSYQREAGSMSVAAITVGVEGSKFSRLGKMRDVGTVTVQGESETLFLKDG